MKKLTVTQRWEKTIMAIDQIEEHTGAGSEAPASSGIPSAEKQQRVKAATQSKQ